MWNFGIPSSLKAWIDHVVRAGKTFNYVGGAVEGLAKGKKAILVLASGGIFSEGALEIMGFRAAVSAPDSGLHWNWMTSRPYGPGMNIPPLAIHAVSNGEKAVEALVIQKERTMLDQDRKSTRLNSSHGSISYAVFCLKKKKKKHKMKT